MLFADVVAVVWVVVVVVGAAVVDVGAIDVDDVLVAVVSLDEAVGELHALPTTRKARMIDPTHQVRRCMKPLRL